MGQHFFLTSVPKFLQDTNYSRSLVAVYPLEDFLRNFIGFSKLENDTLQEKVTSKRRELPN